MGVVSNIKKKLGLGGDYVYECADCGEEFRSSMARSLASCPECGSENTLKGG